MCLIVGFDDWENGVNEKLFVVNFDEWVFYVLVNVLEFW